MFAFRNAVALGYQYLETDVHATRDGHLIAFHDAVLDRVTDRTGKIADLPWAEVSQARIAGLDPIPKLAELLAEFAQTKINIDLKASGAVAPLIEVIAEFNAWDRVCVGSFSQQRLWQARRLARRRLGSRRPLATSVGPWGVRWARLAPQLLKTIRPNGGAYQVPVTHSFGPFKNVPILTEKLISAAHRSKQQIHVWTINDAAEMNRILDLGIDGIITDRIDILTTVLADRNLPIS